MLPKEANMPNRTKIINDSIGGRIKQLRQSRSITQKELSEMLYKSESTVRMWELGKSEPDLEMLKKIANFFNVSVDYLLNDGLITKRGVKIPVFGNVAAGIPIDAITDIEDYEEITEELAASGEYVALKIKGDSMEPKMSEGDVVIVRVQPTIESGEIAIVLINGDNATCKKVKKTEEGIMLISLNSAYEPMFYSNKQIEELPIRIFGKVVELRAKF